MKFPNVLCFITVPSYVMTFDVIPWFLHSIYVTIFSCDMLSRLFLENIFFLCNRLKPSYVMTFNVIPWFLHSIYVTIFSCDMLSTLFLENIFFLCNHLKPSYVMTFDIIPVFFSFSNGTKNNIDNGPGPPQKSWNNVDKLFWC